MTRKAAGLKVSCFASPFRLLDSVFSDQAHLEQLALHLKISQEDETYLPSLACRSYGSTAKTLWSYIWPS